jgi:alpha-L-rhamnosidase
LRDVLAKYGYADTAYKLLLQSDAPGWLYEVGEDATTVWETWTGIDENGKPYESSNNYSYGAICGWLFGGVCGIQYADVTLTIFPTPDKSLGYAKDAYDSQAGRIVNGWRYDGDAVTYELEIPANLTADVTLPDGRRLTLPPENT